MIEVYTYEDLLGIGAIAAEDGSLLALEDGTILGFGSSDYDGSTDLISTESGDLLSFEDGSLMASNYVEAQLPTSGTISTTWVCDRCGFAYPKNRTSRIGQWHLCESCIDEE